MNAVIHLPDGKEMKVTKDVGGVQNIFCDETGNLVIVSKEKVTKSNFPFILEYDRKIVE